MTSPIGAERTDPVSQSNGKRERRPVRDAATLSARSQNLSVEIWVPEYEPAALRPNVIAGPCAGPRVIAAASVLCLHAALGAWLLLDSGARASRRSPPTPLQLLALAPRAAPAPAITVDLPMLKVAPQLTLASEVAVPISLPIDAVQSPTPSASEASDDDLHTLRTICGHIGFPPVAAQSPAITLLVRVERDGRVSDSRIELGSGTQRFDESVQQCLSDYGWLTPQRVNGQPISSWQRLRWAVDRSA
jgi:hypothetical protein